MNNYNKRIFFSENLMHWNTMHNARTMPWKGEKDPYKIWLSEIILQQTRVEQGLEYYKSFIKNYSSVQQLAIADEKAIFKLWEGLGYYSRCKNLLASAKYIAFELQGNFPEKYTEILKLKGVGPYTAAAIASFAYNQPYAVVDGNVMRVLARFFGIHTPVDSTIGKNYFACLAQELLDKQTPALYNQGIMDFGATICKPKLPLCDTCTLKTACTAFKKKEVKMLPVKEKKIVKKERFFYNVVVAYKDEIYVRQRTDKDIWQNLWEFIAIDREEKITAEEFMKTIFFRNIAGKNFIVNHISPFYKQQLTHQTIHAVFIYINIQKPLKNDKYTCVKKTALRQLAFPKITTLYFEDKLTLKQ